jgi:hypothetical protein
VDAVEKQKAEIPPQLRRNIPPSPLRFSAGMLPEAVLIYNAAFWQRH